MKLLTLPQPRQPVITTAAGGGLLASRPVTASPDRWLVRLSGDGPDDLLRIFCFPWSGASASSYRAHAQAVWSHIDIVGIQLPGRGTRRSEPACTRLEEPAGMAAEAIRADLRASPSRFAVWGHSYGALLAYETARRLEAAGLSPEAAVLSAGRTPDTPPPVLLHLLNDLQLIRQLGLMGGMSPGRLRDPAFLEYLLPLVRSDLTACETYTPADARPLRCPVISWAGDKDWYAPPADVARWQQYAGSAYRHREFPGGHFFINDIPAVTAALLADIHPVRSRDSARTPGFWRSSIAARSRRTAVGTGNVRAAALQASPPERRQPGSGWLTPFAHHDCSRAPIADRAPGPGQRTHFRRGQKASSRPVRWLPVRCQRNRPAVPRAVRQSPVMACR